MLLVGTETCRTYCRQCNFAQAVAVTVVKVCMVRYVLHVGDNHLVMRKRYAFEQILPLRNNLLVHALLKVADVECKKLVVRCIFIGKHVDAFLVAVYYEVVLCHIACNA